MKFRQPLACGVAISSTTIALFLSVRMAPFITYTVGAFFYMAIALTTWYGGLRPGLLAIVLSMIGVNYFFIPPLYKLQVSTPEEFIRLSLFLAVSLIITLTSTNLRASRRKVEQLSRKLLAESDQRLKLALNAARMGLWDWNIQTGEILWSPEHEQLFGLAPGSFDGKYATFEAYVHPDDRGTVEQSVHRALEDRSSYQCEYRVRWADGSIHWVEGRGHAFYDANGDPIRMTGTILSIDDRKQLEFALRQSEQQFRGIFEAEPECVKIMSADGFLQTINAAGLAIIEADSLEAVQGQYVYPMLDPVYRQAYDDFNHTVSQGNTAEIEYEITGLKGARRWLESRAVPLYVPDRADALVLSVTRDITDRKRLEFNLMQARDELEQRVKDRTVELSEVNDRLLTSLMEQQHTQTILEEQAQLLDLAHDAILTLDLNWVITFWNQGAEAMYGFSKSEALGKHPRYLLQTKSPQHLAEIEVEVFEKGYWEGELTHTNRDGETIVVLSRWVVQKDELDRPVKILEINSDITQRKQTELALRESEAKFRQLAANIHDVFWITDLVEPRVLYISPAYETLWGRSCHALYQNFGEWLKGIHPDDRDRVFQTFREKSGQGYFDHEYRVVHQDGSIRWIRDRAFPIKNETGEIIRLAGIAEDITERRHIEELKNEFIGVISHELRTPLTAIQMSLGLLNTGIYANKPEKAKRMVEIALIDTQRLVHLVNDILDLERLDSGRAALEKTDCQALELMQQAVTEVQSIADRHQITLEIAPTDEPVWAAYDPLIQTLTNLLSNAIKFSPAQSVIHLAAKSDCDRVLFEVRDTGRGIPADKLEDIFGRFQQVDASDSREKGGTGLGLSICRSIIERQGGKIWAESTLGIGSTFFFTLPNRSEHEA